MEESSCPEARLELGLCGDEDGDGGLDEDAGADSDPEACSTVASTPKACSTVASTPKACRTTASVMSSPSGLARSCSSGGLRLPAIAARSSSTGTVGRGGVTRSRLTLRATSKFQGGELSVELAEGDLERGSAGLPPSLSEGETATAEFRSSGPIVGVLRVGGSPPVPFGVQVAVPRAPAAAGPLSPLATGSERCNFVSAPHRQRSVIAHADGLEFSSGLSASGEGVIAEVSISADFHAEMVVVMRRATRKELTRLAQQQALLDAMEKKRYSSLLAQITRSICGRWTPS
mmetsp:Transcript_103769/g.323451  ORF Transcript_103769/g.323451 Transcript_103769/m.323451 type:complete len:289 (-) Transcript_103769:892-1758(-)